MPYRFTHPAGGTDATAAQAAAAMQRTTMILYGAGALTLVLCLTAVDRTGVNIAGVLSLACLELAFAAYLVVARAVPHAVLVGAAIAGGLSPTIIMVLAQMINGTPIFFLWPAILAAYYLQRREVVITFAVMSVGFAAGLVLSIPVPEGRLVLFSDTVVSVGMVTAMVFALKTRLGLLVAQLHRASTTDTLTGMLNRGAWSTAYEESLTEAQLQGTSVVLAMLDVDHFKRINDGLGHEAGDHALRRLAQIAGSEKRHGDVLGRVGGEEFTLLLVDTDLSGARTFCDRLRGTIERATAGDAAPLTVSIGLAASTPTVDGDELLRQADAALYRAKADGRNCVRTAGELAPAAVA